ncbi:hypothetical protein BDF21DRAFT_430824 [Thamnidium elegans]|nr:hypothetical protein BDF21DRAFT_430824 [Thamnidium elegans]
MPITWMIISGTFLIPFDRINQQYLEEARSIGVSRLEIRDTHFPNNGPVTIDLSVDTASAEKLKIYRICRWIA